MMPTAFRYGLAALAAVWLALAALAQGQGAPAAPVMLLKVDGVIGPASAEFIGRGLREAAQAQARLLVLQIDTPGGLDSAMREIVKDILASPVPVVTFVAPDGARAASAGTFIAYASHFAAMSPGTNLGAATPVPIVGGMPGGDKSGKGEKGEQGEKGGKDEKGARGGFDAMSSKAVNDAAAYIRSLAELRGRNADWAERAVREAVSLSAPDALREKVIDVVARDVPELLVALDGREATAGGRTVKLATAKAAVREVEPGWRTQLLQVIANPSIALVLMMIGMYGLILEFGSPGFGVAGTVGAICLLLGLFALQMLPISYAGLALVFLGVALMIAEGLAPSFGVLGAGGVVAFVMGAIMLLREDRVPGFEIPMGLIAGLGITSAVLMVFTVRFAVKSRRLPVRSGNASLVGEPGQVIAASGREGWAYVRGERWQVRAPGPLAQGDAVRVVAVRGLTLDVVPQENSETMKGVQP